MSTKGKPNSEEISNEHQKRYDGKMKDYDATVGDLKKKKKCLQGSERTLIQIHPLLFRVLH